MKIIKRLIVLFIILIPMFVSAETLDTINITTDIDDVYPVVGENVVYPTITSDFGQVNTGSCYWRIKKDSYYSMYMYNIFLEGEYSYQVSIFLDSNNYTLADTVTVIVDGVESTVEPTLIDHHYYFSTTVDGLIATPGDKIPHLVTYEENGGNIVRDTIVIEGQALERPTDPQKAGYEFGGWYTDPALEHLYDFSTLLYGDLTLYAKWTEVELPVIDRVVLNPEFKYVEIEIGQNIFHPELNIETEGVNKNSGSCYWQVYNLNSPVAWQQFMGSTFGEGVYRYNMAFFIDGTKYQVPSTIKVVVDGVESNVSTNLAGNDYYFSVSSRQISAQETVSTKYFVYFDTNGGSEVEKQWVVDGGKVKEPTTPTKEGKVFVGWYTTEDYETRYVFSDPVHSSFTLYAKFLTPIEGANISGIVAPALWEESSLDLSLDNDKLEITEKNWYKDLITVLSPNEVFAPGNGYQLKLTITCMEGYAFVSNPTVNSPAGSTSSIIGKNSDRTEIYITYIFTHLPYQVILAYSNGDTIDELYVPSGSTLEDVEAPTMDGYTFVGWYKDTDFDEEYNIFESVKSNVTLYARFDFNTIIYASPSNGGGFKINNGDTPASPLNASSYVCDSYMTVIPVAKPGYFITEYRLNSVDGELIGTDNTQDYYVDEDNYLHIKMNASYIVYGIFETTGEVVTPVVKVSKGSGSSLVLTWDEMDSALGYKIYRSNYSNKSFSLIKEVTTNTFTNSGLTYGKTYYYKVVAYNDLGSKTSSVVSGVPKPDKVNARITQSGSYNVKLAWDKVSTTGYVLYRSTDGKKWTAIKTFTKNSYVSYNNTKLKSNKVYYYKIRAYKTVSGKKVYGAYSDVVSTKTAPLKPKFSISVNTYNALNINVTKVTGASKYYVFRSTSKSGTYTNLGYTETLKFVDSDLEVGKTYYYKVRACNSLGRCSAYTSYLSKKPTPLAPKNVTKSVEGSSVTLSWDAVDGATGYGIYVSKYSNKNYSYYITVSEGTSFVVPKGKYYKVKAYTHNEITNKNVFSPFSSVVNCK